tara:strand:- start:4774 stop:6117 length:1344 start_codon:yes stop_codon:yes gene_type:complete
MIFAITPERGRALALGFILVSLSAPASAAMLIYEALQRAAERDPTYLAAFAAQRANRERGEQDRGSLRPTVGAFGAAQLTSSDSEFVFGEAQETYPSWTASLEARQPVLRMDWGARGDRATASDDLADALFRQQQIDFVARVSSRYLEALNAQDQLRLIEAENLAVRESLENTRKRYEAELVPGLDLREAEARDDLSRAQRIAAEAAVEDAIDALAELTGPFDRPLPSLKPTAEPPPLPANSVEGWLALAGDNSTALRIAERQAEIAAADLRSRKAETQPMADLVGSVVHNDSTEYSIGQLQTEARIGLEVTVPIYGGGVTSSRYREAQARAEEARYQFQQVREETRRQVARQFRDIQVASANTEAFRRSLVSARAAQAAVEAGYDAGTRTITDVLDAKSRTAQVQRDLNRARYDLLINTLLLQSTAGTLTIDQFLIVDAMFDLPHQ